MEYTLPDGHTSAATLDFSGAVRPKKNPLGLPGRMISTGQSTPPVLGFKCKKFGNGMNGQSNASWRSGRGLGHGMRSKKMMAGKTAGGH